ncbi:MAG: NFACT family protein [Crocosphaera sp.]|uniref:Rqc2 homolog RqcH n=3 Tax=Crocosphaera watsonii TaxID=263511 RepID=T2JVQ5_CROWT|nr:MULTISPECIES: NFACT RNA binding domain-containing protein [Crocosphaera]EHJ13839.1 Fibronectin/fibrinogen-binding protein [Crocosphaera watsonii WH 0003]MCH2245336.1 NFACT family protein [Crocosphaera sp.]CCQ58679.1 Fibronectin/fibrinogen-binding protein [Crocosphaera watsonii WH 0005]CCQ69111.1 Fibronectin/fibrinogen-binding protein [Crocosphaera watsonii WH 0402]
MQSVDVTTLTAICHDLQSHWLPAKVEQVYQKDPYTISIALRTLKKRSWLTISWHPQAARLCIGDPPPRTPDTFTFSDQLRHQLNGFALVNLKMISPWERVVNLQFAKRPGDEPVWHLYVEIMGKYSNVILTDNKQQIVTVAHQVNANQSTVRTVQTGRSYELPPTLTGTFPKSEESQERWQERVSLIPGSIKKQLLNSYRGLSPVVAASLIKKAGLKTEQSTENLTVAEWNELYKLWQVWLKSFQNQNFQPGYTENGYTVLGWGIIEPKINIQTLIDNYYTKEINQEKFKQLKHQLQQKLKSCLKKLYNKANNFQQKMEQSSEAEEYRQKGDLLMAHSYQWEPGMNSMTLKDFETDKPIKIPLNPEKNAIQNAQNLYKKHQKLKRAKGAVEPLLKEVQEEINYLEQVEDSLQQIDNYNSPEDLQTLQEIKEELIQQNYLTSRTQQTQNIPDESQPYQHTTPSGFEVWIGRNNRQNDRLTFRTAGDYDLWFHTQESAGSHVLLRLEPGAKPNEADLNCAADWAAYHSRARQSEQVPVVYTEPKYVYKPKGAKPGMVIYKREKVLWGKPHKIQCYLKNQG